MPGDDTRESVAVTELDPMEAVTTAVCVPVSTPVDAVNDAEVALAGTVTEAGTLKAGRLSVRVTVEPPAGAACESVTVQFVFELADNVDAVHVSAVRPAGAERVRLTVFDEPL
jgi:hypothetical protein